MIVFLLGVIIGIIIIVSISAKMKEVPFITMVLDIKNYIVPAFKKWIITIKNKIF